ncbi:unnamed protein product [Oikopleura dioica]|uniref:SH3 domain-containing protein n=1 Tax=Oikopleura dioica TaxID=34765 RepID=E4YFY6_OIKDI|nr:unnamed protein product [Oikopleura dioica]
MNANNYARAKFSYEPQNADELSLTKGDYVEIFNNDEDEWWEARILTSNDRGWIPKAYMRPLKGQKELDKVLRLLRKSPKARNSGAEPDEQAPQNDWFKKVYIEVIEDSKKYLRDVEAIRTTCAKVREALGDTAYAVSKLEASSDKLRGVENRIVERFQNDIDAESPSAGKILNETLEEYKNVYESYHVNHPTAVDSLQREEQHLNNLDLNAIRSSWAKPLLRLENFPLRLRDLEKYYGDGNEDRNLLARSIYQIEEVLLQKCQNIRKNKELELAVLQQPIRNWTGEPIDELGSLRLMTPLMIRAGREIKAHNGYGLVFSSAIVLITATDRMSGFVLVANIPKVKLAVSRKSEICVETTGQAGHFWFDFESKEDTDEWWGAMEALNVQISKSLSTNQILHTSDRSSFSEVNGHGNSKSRDRVNIAENNLSVDRRAPRSKSGSPYAVMAPVKHVPIRTSRNPIDYSSYNHNQSSPPPIKLCPSSSTLSTTASSTFCARPTPPYRTTSPKPARSKDRKSKSFRSRTPEHHQTRDTRPNPRDHSIEVMGIYEAYNSTNRRRKNSDPSLMAGRISQIPLANQQSFHRSMEDLMELKIGQLRQEFEEKFDKLKERMESADEDRSLLKATIRATRNNLLEEQATRRRLEAKIQEMINDRNTLELPPESMTFNSHSEDH